MTLAKLVKTIVAALEEIKARDIEVLDVKKISTLFDRMIIASADSARQTKAIANNVAEKVKAAGGSVYGIEGEETASGFLSTWEMCWCMLCRGHPSHYNLEELWAEAKKIKRATASAPGGTSPVSALGERSEAPVQAGAKPKMSKTSESQLDPDGED